MPSRHLFRSLTGIVLIAGLVLGARAFRPSHVGAQDVSTTIGPVIAFGPVTPSRVTIGVVQAFDDHCLHDQGDQQRPV